jgi:hypothetical protein
MDLCPSIFAVADDGRCLWQRTALPGSSGSAQLENWAGNRVAYCFVYAYSKSNREERNRPVKHRNVTSEWIERQSLPSFMLPCAYLLRAGEPRRVVSG